MKYKVTCDWCGKEFERYASNLKGKTHIFCSRQCLAKFSSKKTNPVGYADLKDYTNIRQHMVALNMMLNPIRMTTEVRSKLRSAKLNSGDGVTYSKLYGVPEHRALAEKMLGRPLFDGEVVHHIDGDKRNNSPDNLMILPSQSEHAKLHIRERRFWEGGDSL